MNMGNDVEIFLINDGSTNPHIEPILKEIEYADSRFRYVYKSNSGVSETRNLGIKMAQGEYITFIDSDDYLEPDALQYMVKETCNQKADFAILGWCKDDNRINCDRFKKVYRNEEKKDALLAISGLKYNLRPYAINMNIPGGKLFRRSFLEKHHLRYNQFIKFGEDAFFNFCNITFADCVYIDNKLVIHYVSNDSSATKKFSDQHIKNLPILLNTWENFVCKHFSQDKMVYHTLSFISLLHIREIRAQYFTHPNNSKSFFELKSELHSFLYQPTINKWIKEMRLSDAKNIIDLKNILLLKIHLYWIYLITERKKRKL